MRKNFAQRLDLDTLKNRARAFSIRSKIFTFQMGDRFLHLLVLFSCDFEAHFEKKVLEKGEHIEVKFENKQDAGNN